jgi:hypothetical protein
MQAFLWYIQRARPGIVRLYIQPPRVSRFRPIVVPYIQRTLASTTRPYIQGVCGPTPWDMRERIWDEDLRQGRMIIKNIGIKKFIFIFL